jgi:RimJ/RimL family protein N-acetyltransferase
MTLEGKQVRLRPFEERDLEHIMEWINDHEVTRTLLVGRYPMTRPMEKEWLETRLRASETEVGFAIETLAGLYLGGISFFRILAVERHAELGLVIGRKSEWGKGYAREAMKLMVDYGFEQLNFNMIYLSVLAGHERAHRIYVGLGFREEGRLRQRIYRDGQYHDLISLSLLRSEWQANRTA